MTIPPDERGASPVAGKWRLFKSAKSRKVIIAGSIAGVVGLVVMGVNAAIHDPGIKQRPGDTGSTTIGQTVPSPPALPEIVAAPQPAEAKPQIVYVHDKPTAPSPSAPAIVVADSNYVRMPAGSGETSFDVAPPKPQEDHGANSAAAAVAADAAKDATLTKVAFKSSVLPGGKAGPAIRLTYLMMPQFIPCALDVAMDSTLAGAISCHTTTDILSPDHVLLMPAGTMITGTYKNDVKTGQHRLFAFAGSAITKEGIPVPLDSEVSDGLGRAGIEGAYDGHTLERFGAALALTAVDAGVSLGQAALSSNNGNSTLNIGSSVTSGNGISAIAQEILRNQINIPPTITVSPGTIVSIVVDHPIDFSDALKVRTSQ
jgi:type IV secretion system protein VirB10